MIPKPRPAAIVPMGHFGHLDLLDALGDDSRYDLVNAIASWFVSHPTLDRERLMLLIEEAGAL